MFIEYLYNFFGEILIKLFAYFYWIVFLLLSYKRFLYILDQAIHQIHDLQLFSSILWVIFSLF